MSIDPALLEAYLAWSGDEARRGILDHRLDNYCLDGLTVEQAIRTILDEEGIEWSHRSDVLTRKVVPMYTRD